MTARRAWLLGTIFVWHSALADSPDASRARALELSDESDRAYEAGDFARAADLVRGAYALYPEPILLYNLGRALERSGDVRGAIEQYTRYAATNPDDRAAVDAKIAALRVELPPEPTDPQPVVIAAPPPAEAPHLQLPLLTAATGLAAIAVGVGFGVESSRAHDLAASAPIQLDAQHELDRAHRDAAIADVLFATGGALAIGGAAWAYVVAHHREPGGVVSHLRVTPRSVGFAWELP